MADLADIDAHIKTTAPIPRMDRLVELLADDELDVLRRACGFGDNPSDKRPYTAIAVWLDSLGYDVGGKITNDHVSRWAQRG